MLLLLASKNDTIRMIKMKDMRWERNGKYGIFVNDSKYQLRVIAKVKGEPRHEANVKAFIALYR